MNCLRAATATPREPPHFVIPESGGPGANVRRFNVSEDVTTGDGPSHLVVCPWIPVFADDDFAKKLQ
jgi:hypothetical protein